MKFRAVVFDWDGTLFDSMSYKRENFIELFLPYTIDRSLLRAYHIHASGVPRKELFNQCLQKFKQKSFSEEEYIQISDCYTSMNIKASKYAKCFPEVIALLEKIQSMGLQMFVSSSSAQEELLQVVSASGVASYFTEILGSQDRLKKGPQHMDYICSKYQLNKDEVVFVGDDEKDLELGRAAKVFSLRIMRQQQLVKKNIITELGQLVDFLF